MKIFFISRANLESGRTNVYNAVKTCEAFNLQNGFKATFITTDYPLDHDELSKRMGLKTQFEVRALGITSTRVTPNKFKEMLLFIFKNIQLALYLIKRRREFDVIYFRDEWLSPSAFFMKLFGKKVFFETHSVLQNKFRQILNNIAIKFSDGVVAISTGLKNYYEKINKNIVVSLCSAAEEDWFDFSKDKNAFRKQLDLPEDKFLIGYTGVVGANPNGDYYELDDILISLKTLPNKTMFVIVGEMNGNAEWLRVVANKEGLTDRLVLVPWQERKQTYKYLQAFDVVAIPRRKKDLIGDSPAKMFPALASRRPIVAGKSEFIEEVLTNGVDAAIVEENSYNGWSEAIRKILEDPNMSEKLIKNAQVTKAKYTWEKRGEKIAHFIKHAKTR